METEPYLIFSLHGPLYGVKAACVQEIVQLPELIALEEAPPFIAGVFNFRGKVVPVIDLDVRFGRAPEKYRLSDMIIVLEAGGALAGIIVNEALGLKNISPSEVEALPEWVHGEARFLEGEAKDGSGLIMLLSLESLTKQADALTETGPAPAKNRLFCPDAAPREREVFSNRADSLMLPAVESDGSELAPLAAVRLGGEYFGVELELVREFTELRGLAPVPCSPGDIVGDMNLRGDILTIVDVRGLLKMPMTGPVEGAKVIVIELDDLRAGVLVDEVCEVVRHRPEEVIPVPLAVDPAEEGYLKGTLPFHGKILSVLDLKKMLGSANLIVNEDVQA